MHILVINSGSSSIKFTLFDAQAEADPTVLLDGELSGVSTPEAQLTLAGADPKPTQADTIEAATKAVFEAIATQNLPSPQALGYRVVHPGPNIKDHTRITPDLLEELEKAAIFAPLHDPVTLKVIRAGLERFPTLPHFACFDTVFHNTLPEPAYTYPIPADYRAQGVRRYGFHGLSCESILHALSASGQTIPSRLVIAHLGSGCSVTACRNGLSIDTTMGLTPDGGIVMGTRPGDLDPGLVLYLLRQQTSEDPASAVESILNKKSGMAALSAQPNDMRRIRTAAEAGDPHAKLALEVFTRSVTKSIGAFQWLLGGLDAIIFTGGIGEHDPATRQEVLANLQALGIQLDTEANQAPGHEPRIISKPGTPITIHVIPAQEDQMIALHVRQMATQH